MIQFAKSNKGHLGRVDIIQMAIIDNGVVSKAAGRPGFDPFFLMNITFSSNSPHCICKVPTGVLEVPEAEAPTEVMLSDGDRFYAARYASSSDLEYMGVPIDPNLYILDDDELPDRLLALTTADKNLIMKKIAEYCLNHI
jgi:hypothetical protein